ncbi:transglycosylase domain-containing protein [Streptomyces sp. FXJ1.172]|uniref:transglycosylase domain-containing protein n=1 Tax=Streptomyces sp. FXJ1.172 TaxID=710705 RepID=UPI0007D02DE6|nr:transglycosylase domain-containing protein [Streptomyces sp. FXJ1.172]WEO94291.1 transglycosylase domain-containing protein [Streptomyces sp. FXJ1.172]
MSSTPDVPDQSGEKPVRHRRRIPFRVRTRRRRARWIRRALIAVLVFFLALCTAAVVAYRLTVIPAPHPETVMQSTVFLDASGQYLGRRGPVDRQNVPLSQVPHEVQDAVIAAENRSFRTDSGVSPTAILRAAWSTLSGGERQGGSTITQQYVKNALLTPQQSLSRKASEALIALKLDRTRTKDAILQGYLNTVYFGRGAAGIESAARNYFGVGAKDLSLSQGAALAAIINLPSYYERVGADAQVTATLEKRWAWVLDGMRGAGTITAGERASAAFPAFRFYPPGDTDGQRQYLIDAAGAEAADRLGITQDQLARGGYTVRTTFDIEAQDDTAQQMGQAPPAAKGTRLHTAVVAMIPGDGAIRVLYGGADYARQPFNDAVAGAVEAGSALAPLRASEPGAAAAASLVRTPTPTPLQLASAYATASAQGTYAKPYTVAEITRGGRTVYTAHPRTRELLPVASAHPAATGVTGCTGTAGSGAATTRTLWHTESDRRLSVTVALFADHPARGKRAATPAHLSDARAAKGFAAGLAQRVREKVTGG